MRILIQSINYAPELIGIGKYTTEMAEWLAEHGHEVRIITAPPWYPSWRVTDGYSARRYRRETIGGVSVWRCPVWVGGRPTALSRLLQQASFALSSLPVTIGHIFWKPDVVVTIEPPLFCAAHAWLSARLCRATSWIHVQDFEVEAFFGLGFGTSRLLRKIVACAEGWLMRRFDHASTISAAMAERISTLRGGDRDGSIFPNWVDVEKISPFQKGRDLRAEWGYSAAQKIILYAGNLGKKQGLEIILHAAEEIAKSYPQALFLLVGEGAAKADLIAKTQRLAIRNIDFRPLQPAETLPALLAMADLHLIVQKRGAADAVMPSKLTGILAVGGHVIITADPDTELGRLVRNNPGIAVLVEPENREELVKGISTMIESNTRLNQVARQYAKCHLAKEAILNRFERDLQKYSRRQKQEPHRAATSPLVGTNPASHVSRSRRTALRDTSSDA